MARLRDLLIPVEIQRATLRCIHSVSLEGTCALCEAMDVGQPVRLIADPTASATGATRSNQCDFVFSNQYKGRFPCQRPSGHNGAHSLSRFRGDEIEVEK